MAPWVSSGKLTILKNHVITAADVTGDRVRSLSAKSLLTGTETILNAPWFIDATELGDLLPITGTEYLTGAESKSDNGAYFMLIIPNFSAAYLIVKFYHVFEGFFPLFGK